jgi:hemerythrin-like metal-binding protein
MSQSNVPYGSQQLPANQSHGFALPWVGQLAEQGKELNAEHEAVLQKLNALLLALNSGDATAIVMACSVMSTEARAHFANEEELMLAADYPYREAHVEQHDELLRGLARIRFSLTSGSGFWSPADAQSMLERWFVPHLTYADQRFADFMAAQGGEQAAA